MMIIPVLFIFLCCRTLVQAFHEGHPCKWPGGRTGVCTLRSNCDLINPELTEKLLSIISCKKFPLYVCCPQRPPTRVRSMQNSNRKPGVTKPACIGEIARQKCSEYSKYVYEWGYSWFERRKIPRNRCATRVQKLIFGGTKAEPREFPHMAAIGFNAPDNKISWSCGGSIISERFILTAAHCTWSNDGDEPTWVRVGDLNLEDPNDGAKPQDIRIREIIPHPDYKRPKFYHDIALLRLETDIIFNGWARPACLHTKPTTGTEKAVAVGWGDLDYQEETRDMRKVTLPIVDSKNCNTEWMKTDKLPNGINETLSICAGIRGRDTCNGDSGGPLVIPSSMEYCMSNIVGVTSIGQFCGYIPGVYTRVYHYVPWIESEVWGRE